MGIQFCFRITTPQPPTGPDTTATTHTSPTTPDTTVTTMVDTDTVPTHMPMAPTHTATLDSQSSPPLPPQPRLKLVSAYSPQKTPKTSNIKALLTPSMRRKPWANLSRAFTRVFNNQQPSKQPSIHICHI